MKYENEHFGENQTFSIYTPTDLTFHNHSHRSFELILVESGQLEVIVDDTFYELKQSDLFFLCPNQYHEIKTINHSSLILFIFSPELVEDFYAQLTNKVFETPILTVNQSSFANIKKILLQDSTLYKKKALLYDLIDAYLNHSQLVDYLPKNGSVINDILEYIEAHFKGELSLATLAKELGYSYNYLSALINNEMKLTFNQLVNRYRINYAVELLTQTNLPVTEIASHVGYQSLRSFNRNFKLLQEVSPTAYKRIERNLLVR